MHTAVVGDEKEAEELQNSGRRDCSADKINGQLKVQKETLTCEICYDTVEVESWPD